MREIVFDTETTGLDPYQGHRLLEIGCIELVNRFPTGQTFHHYLNPERDVPAERHRGGSVEVPRERLARVAALSARGRSIEARGDDEGAHGGVRS